MKPTAHLRRRTVRLAARAALVLSAVVVPAHSALATDMVAAPTSTTSTIPTSTTSAIAPTSPPARIAAVTVVASAKRTLTPAYESPTAFKPFVTFDNRTNFSGRHVFVVVGQQGDSYKVLLPMRPNGRTGFVKAKDVNLYQHDYASVISLSARTLTLYKAGKEVLKDTVAVGSLKYPTPTGTFYMRELARPRNPRGAYGPWAFGLSGYSNVLQKFGRGDGQIGSHGTNEPDKLGLSISHGCIRLRNATITKLAQMLPQGVPVEIVA